MKHEDKAKHPKMLVSQSRSNLFRKRTRFWAERDMSTRKALEHDGSVRHHTNNPFHIFHRLCDVPEETDDMTMQVTYPHKLGQPPRTVGRHAIRHQRSSMGGHHRTVYRQEVKSPNKTETLARIAAHNKRAIKARIHEWEKRCRGDGKLVEDHPTHNACKQWATTWIEEVPDGKSYKGNGKTHPVQITYTSNSPCRYMGQLQPVHHSTELFLDADHNGQALEEERGNGKKKKPYFWKPLQKTIEARCHRACFGIKLQTQVMRSLAEEKALQHKTKHMLSKKLC